MTEAWKDVIGYEGRYKVSNTGKIFKTINSQLSNIGEVRLHVNARGYATASLYKDGKAKNYVVHRLVASAFIPNTHNREFVNHKDGNKLNNIVSNLEWCTRSENLIHAYKVGLMKRRKYGDGPNAKTVFNTQTGERHTSVVGLAESLGISYYSLWNQLTGRSKNNTPFQLLHKCA